MVFKNGEKHNLVRTTSSGKTFIRYAEIQKIKTSNN